MLAQEDRLSRALHLFCPESLMPVTVHVLQEGMAGPKVRSTVSLVIDGDHVIVIDPGMAPSQSAILEPLGSHGIEPAEVTDVIISTRSGGDSA